MTHMPESDAGLNAEWMTDCLRESGALRTGVVRATQVTRFAEGVGLLGQLSRVTLQYSADASGELPASLVVKLASSSAQNVTLCEAIRLYWRENQFYTRSQRETPLRTARIHRTELVGLTKLVLVMEDLGAATAGNQIEGATPEQVRCAVTHIARHHAAFWGRGQAGNESWVPSLNDASICPIVQHITSLGTPMLLAQLPECFNATTRAVVAQFVPKMPALAKLICSGQTTFCHGDYRIDNLLFGLSPTEPLAVVDWQICWDACPAYDIAYLMTQSVEPGLRRTIEQDVLRLYFDELLSNGIIQYSREQLFEDYRRAATYCLCYPLIAAGTLDLSNARGRALGSMMLNRALSATEDLDSLRILRALDAN
jgi:Ecdysteroid kinase-like family